MEKLTRMQEKTLNFMKEFIVSHGYPPTVREIGKALNLSSPATVHSHITNLENKGYIKKDSSKNRAIELMVENEFLPQNQDVVKVALLGRVTAGNPIEAIEKMNETFSLPAFLIPNNKEVFALDVVGDSMINAGIHDGDIVIVQRSKTAKNGEIVVVMTTDNEVTLKRFYNEGTHIRLKPENDFLEDIILDNATILGKAIGLYRKIK